MIKIPKIENLKSLRFKLSLRIYSTIDYDAISMIKIINLNTVNKPITRQIMELSV